MGTISTHFGGGEMKQAHNRREKSCVENEPHIDPNGYHETIIDEPIKDAYERIFGEAIAEYNAKQKRADRKKTSDGYYNELKKSDKFHEVYEGLIGVYQDGLSQEEQIEILHEYLESFQKRNSHFEVIGAYIHGDEKGKGFHMHLDVIPVGDGYKKGLEKQCSQSRAIEQQGIKPRKGETEQIAWELAENRALEMICARHGIDVEHPQAGLKVHHKNKRQLDLERREREVEVKEALVDEKIEKLEKLVDRAEKLHEIEPRTTMQEVALQNTEKAINKIVEEVKSWGDTEYEIEF